MPFQLSLHSVSKSYPHRRVLDAVSGTVRAGERVGLVGENGAGKSTLLRIIAGTETPDAGTVTVLADGIGTLDLPPEGTVGGAVDHALADLRALERRMLRDPGGDLLTEFERRGGWTADARVRRAMSVLGVGDLADDRDLSSLSGGQRARLALAGAVEANPELLLLDEPTTHLDAAGQAWLADRLRRHRGTLVLATHDRWLLDRVTTAILEIDGDRGTLHRYGTGYAGYRTARRAARQRWEQAHAQWAAEVEHWTGWAATTAHRVAPGRPIRDNNKCKYHGDGRRVQEAIRTRTRAATERLERLRADPVPEPPAPLRLRAPAHAPVTEGVVLAARDVRVAGRLADISLEVRAGERILLDGPNGAGKSTLLDVLAGRLAPDAGVVERRGRVAHLPQHSGPAAGTVLTAFGGGAAALRDLGLFRDEDFATPVAHLSTGQRRRLDLARLLATEADVLLLDEPTNHLSPALAEELVAAVLAYPGAVVVAGHDRWLRGCQGFRTTLMQPSSFFLKMS